MDLPFSANPYTPNDPPIITPLGGQLVLCLGTDLVHIPRIEKLYQQYDLRFLDKMFTTAEKAFVLTPSSLKVKVSRMGSRLAAKEAVLKALGVGIATFGNAKGGFWRDVEMLRNDKQAPKIKLYGRAQQIAAAKGIEDWLISVSHDGDYASCTVLGVKPFSRSLIAEAISL